MKRTSLEEALRICPQIRPTRQTTGGRRDMGGTNYDPDIDPFCDFDAWNSFEGRTLVLPWIENSPGPATDNEATWAQKRIVDLVRFSEANDGLMCERGFANRLLAWYVSSCATEALNKRAIAFALRIYQASYRQPLSKKNLTKAISTAIHRHNMVYRKVPELSPFLKTIVKELLTDYHTAVAWEMAADILETLHRVKDVFAVVVLTVLLQRYREGKTGRDSGRRPDKVEPQELWTAAELAYLEAVRSGITLVE